MKLHRCAAPGCKRSVPDRWVFCSRCWAWLPAELQVGIYNEYDGAKRTRRFIAKVRDACRVIEPHFAQVEMFAEYRPS